VKPSGKGVPSLIINKIITICEMRCRFRRCGVLEQRVSRHCRCDRQPLLYQDAMTIREMVGLCNLKIGLSVR